jgi:hypothetical protein
MLNSTNQILHPCILVTLFGGDARDGPDDDNDGDSTISPPVLRGWCGEAPCRGAHHGYRRWQDVLCHRRQRAPPVAAGVRPHQGAPRGLAHWAEGDELAWEQPPQAGGAERPHPQGHAEGVAGAFGGGGGRARAPPVAMAGETAAAAAAMQRD